MAIGLTCCFRYGDARRLDRVGFGGEDDGEKSNLKVIISSGYNVETAGQGSPTRRGIVYFQKPYKFEMLSKIVRDCLDRA